MRHFVILIFLSSFTLFCQNPKEEHHFKSHSLALSGSIERNDVFLSISYLHQQKFFTLNPSIGIGLVHTMAQNNPLLRVGCMGYYNWIKKPLENYKDFIFAVGAGASYASYRAPVRTHFCDFKLGYLLQYGGRIKLMHSSSFGGLSEVFSGNSRQVSLFYPNFSFSIGFSYEI